MIVFKSPTSLLSRLLVYLVGLTALAWCPWTPDAFEFPKFVVLVFISVLIGFLYYSSVRDFVKKIPPLCIFFLVLYGIGQVGAFVFSLDRVLSSTGNVFRYQGVLESALYVGLLVVATYFFYIAEREEIFKYTRGIYYVAGCLASIAIVSYSGIIFNPALADGRAFGTLGNPNVLACFLAALLPFCIVPFSSVARWFLFLLICVALITTGSRSAWMALLIALVVAGIMVFKKHSSKKLVLFGMSALLIVSSLFLIGAWHHTSTPILKRFSFDYEQSQSVTTRILLWQAGWQMFLNRPLFGFGQDTTQKFIAAYLPSKDYDPTGSIYIDRIHSEPLDILVASGLFSLIGYLGIFIYLISSAWSVLRKSVTPIDVAMLISLVIIFLYHLVNFSTLTSNMLWYINEGYFLALVIRSQSPVEKSSIVSLQGSN